MAKKGEKLSDEHKSILIESNKNRVWTKEQRMARAELAKKTHTGMKRSEETKRKMSFAQKGKRKKKEHITPFKESVRRCSKYVEWRLAVFERDDYTCQFCGVRGCVINADHIKTFAMILDEYSIKTLEESEKCKELWDINNGRTLCVPCHKSVGTHGKPLSRQKHMKEKHSTRTSVEGGKKRKEIKIPFQNEGSYWFRRLVRDLYKQSRYFKVRRIRDGFFRIYWKDAYVHEMYKEMPYRGYVWYTDSPYKESFKLMQEFEQDGEIQRKVKNFVEGYSEASKAIRIRIYQFKNDDYHYRTAKDMYKQVVIK